MSREALAAIVLTETQGVDDPDERLRVAIDIALALIDQCLSDLSPR